jgi:hypothetical protein
VHNETLSVAAMRVRNLDSSPVGIDFSEQFREEIMEKAIVEQQTLIFEQQIQIDDLAATVRFFHRHPLRYVSGKLKAKLKARVKARLNLRG